MQKRKKAVYIINPNDGYAIHGAQDIPAGAGRLISKDRSKHSNRSVSNRHVGQENKAREINTDFSLPVIVEANILEQPVLATAAIRQKCFEHVRGNKFRLTTLAQLPAGRAFKKFGGEGGVEFFVLSGVFSDDAGDYSAGCYVRNPATAHGEPYTRNGCTVLFKLGQFQPLDRKQVVIDTRASTVHWQPAGEPGVSYLELHHFAEETVGLYRIRAECWITLKNPDHGEELFVCEGDIRVDGRHYKAGTWLRYPAGSKSKISTSAGASLYFKKTSFQY